MRSAAHRFGRVLAAIWGVLFLFGAAVQFNDPDPVRWAAIYTAAAAACLAAARRRAVARIAALPLPIELWLRLWLPLAVGVVALGWALSMLPTAFGRVPFPLLFKELSMASVAVEEAREMYGLFIIAAIMACVVTMDRMTRGARLAPSDAASEGSCGDIDQVTESVRDASVGQSCSLDNGVHSPRARDSFPGK